MDAIWMLSILAFVAGVCVGVFITDKRNFRELKEFQDDLDNIIRQDCALLSQKDREIRRLHNALRHYQVKEAKRREENPYES